MNGWIGVDLDGTLAQYDEWRGPTHIGPPVHLMVERVKRWLGQGIDVRIFTARVYRGAALSPDPSVVSAIQQWSREHIGCTLTVTNEKDYGMIELWDDRAVQVEANTGRRMDGQPEPEGPA